MKKNWPEAAFPNRVFQYGPNLRLIGRQRQIRRIGELIRRHGSRRWISIKRIFDTAHLAAREPLVNETANRAGGTFRELAELIDLNRLGARLQNAKDFLLLECQAG